MIQIGTVSADIRFSAESLERIFSDPDGVLEDVEAFWDADEAMHCVKGWHAAVNVPVDWDHFRTVVTEIAKCAPAIRASHPALATTRRVVQQQERFLASGLEHLCGFLPDNPAELDIKVLFTGGIRAYAFAWEQIVIDSTSKFWHGQGLSVDETADWILNLLVHECWHGGYSENRGQRTETPLADAACYRLLDNIHNEGLATFVNYTAQSIFPAPANPDFQMLDDPSQVRVKFESMISILEQLHDLDEEAHQKLAWDEGVIGRAFYIGGAHMARTLEERAGRRALTDTIAKGPLSFVLDYNAVADAGLCVSVPGT